MCDLLVDIRHYRVKALSYVLAVACWKRFCDDRLVLLEQCTDDLDIFFHFMNSKDSSKKIQFYISCPTDNGE